MYFFLTKILLRYTLHVNEEAILKFRRHGVQVRIWLNSRSKKRKCTNTAARQREEERKIIKGRGE